MMITEAWCRWCGHKVIPDVRMEARMVTAGMEYVCKGWFCPICGRDLGPSQTGIQPVCTNVSYVEVQ